MYFFAKIHLPQGFGRCLPYFLVPVIPHQLDYFLFHILETGMIIGYQLCPSYQVFPYPLITSQLGMWYLCLQTTVQALVNLPKDNLVSVYNWSHPDLFPKLVS